MMSNTQIAAMVMVIRVNVSPALDPNGLDPPAPPNAPISPPPLPRWIRMVRIRSRPIAIMAKFNRFDRNVTWLDTIVLRGVRPHRRVRAGAGEGNVIGRPGLPGNPETRTREKRHGNWLFSCCFSGGPALEGRADKNARPWKAGPPTRSDS